MDKLTAIKTFIKVAEAGRFSRAADALGIPNARVSQRVSDLEKSLGVRLIHRTTQAMNLTNDGLIYYEKCVSLLDELAETEAQLQGHTENPSGILRIEAVSSISRWLIAPNLQDFEKRFPNIRMELGCSDRRALLPGSRIDCALRGGALEDSSFISKSICDIHFGIYGSAELGELVKTPDDLHKVRCFGIFSHGSGKSMPWRLERDGHWVDIAVSEHHRFEDHESALIAAQSGGGLVLAPPFLAYEWVKKGRVIPVLPDWTAGTKPLHIVYPSARHLPRRVRVFIDWIVEIADAHPLLKERPMALAAEKVNALKQ